MGCDIHMFGEQRQNGHWVDNETELSVGRNYFLFGLLAKVRRDFKEYSFAPRGLPEDVSSPIEYEYSRFDDLHTPSWLGLWELQETLVELLLVPEANQQDTGLSYAVEGLQSLVTQIKEIYTDDPRNFRIVFWFDN